MPQARTFRPHLPLATAIATREEGTQETGGQEAAMRQGGAGGEGKSYKLR